MKLPKLSDYPLSLVIGQEDYKVRFVETIRKDRTLMGLYCPDEHTIYIRKGQTAPEIMYTFIHEVLHAFEEEYDIKLSHRNVYKLEKAIGDFMLNNL